MLGCRRAWFEVARARQKAMGEALFERSCRETQIRSPGDPLIELLIFFVHTICRTDDLLIQLRLRELKQTRLRVQRKQLRRGS